MISLEDANMRRKFGFAAQILRAFESADAVVLLKAFFNVRPLISAQTS